MDFLSIVSSEARFALCDRESLRVSRCTEFARKPNGILCALIAGVALISRLGVRDPAYGITEECG